MGKNTEPKYVRLTIDNTKLVVKGRPITEEQLKVNVKDAIAITSKEVSKFITICANAKRKIDFVLMCGTIGFYCENKTARDIIRLQNTLLAKVDEKFNEFNSILHAKKRDTEAIEKAEIEYMKTVKDAKKQLFDFININIPNFTEYAYVNLNEFYEYTGSYYDGNCEESGHIYRTYYEGIINVSDYLAALEKHGFINGVSAEDESIGNSIEFLKNGYNCNRSAYFGYAVPVTKRCNRGKTKALKNLESKKSK